MLKRMTLLVALARETSSLNNAWRRRGVYRDRSDMPPLDAVAAAVGAAAPWAAPKWVWAFCWRAHARLLPALHARDGLTNTCVNLQVLWLKALAGDDAAYALLAALRGGDRGRDAALRSRRSEPPRKSKPLSERRRPVETVGESHGRAAKPRLNRRCMQCSTCVNPRLKKRCLGREEGFIEDEPEPARNEEDENSPEKLLEEVERDLNTVVFPQENTVMLPQEYAARAAHIAQLQRSLAIRNAETASRSMPPPVKLRHNMRPAFVNNEEEPPRHDPMPQNVDIDDEEEEEEEPAPKRKRGRPPGSKSKPKPDTASQPQHSQPPPPINAPIPPGYPGNFRPGPIPPAAAQAAHEALQRALLSLLAGVSGALILPLSFDALLWKACEASPELSRLDAPLNPLNVDRAFRELEGIMQGVLRVQQGQLVALDVGRNVCHGSDSVENAELEIKLWFGDGLTEWDSHSEAWVYE